MQLIFALAFSAVLGAMAWPRWRAIRDNSVAMADAHIAYGVAHPGWSFPARIWSAPAPLDLPPARIWEQARARGYAEACPPAEPGQFCKKTNQVNLRGGQFPEGAQPAGGQGWTRPLALEPVLIGWLVGPDGELREHLPIQEAPRHLIAAIIASEDEAYFEHSGVNLRGVARATYVNLRGGLQQGASTLTMQVVRNLSQDKERSLHRKLREIFGALALDRHLGKEKVLQLYLDAPYLGQAGSFSVCGFQAAARYYWGKDARELSLAQSATLAAILPAPGRYAPDRAPEVALERRNRLLRHMAERGWDGVEVEAALAEPMGASPHELPAPLHPAYLQATRLWLEDNVPAQTLYGAGLHIWTALDLAAQQTSEKVLYEKLRYLERVVGRSGQDPLEAAGVVLDTQSGLMVAAYGGTIETATDFSRATQAKRQAGSSLKPMVYALAFNQPGEGGLPRYTAAHAVPNAPRTFPNTNGWRPRNVGGEYSSTANLAQGLAWSQNIATASLLEELGGPRPMIELARRMAYDVRTWPEEMGLALGQGEVTPLEQARFVATVARGGKLASGRPVVMATDPSGQVRIPEVEPGTQVLSAEGAALTRELMRLVIEVGTGGGSRGTGGFAGYAGPAIGKTGTTDLEKDLWFIGASPTFASAVWLGYDQPLRIGASASDLAAPLWGWWNNALHTGLPQKEFEGIKTTPVGICRVSGKRGNGSCPMIGAPFLTGTAPKGACPMAHPPPDPNAPPKEHESLWKRRAREAEERAAAEAGGAAPPPSTP